MLLSFGVAHAEPLTQESVRTRALQVLGRWVDAQNHGDATAYLGLYDAASFHGKKRTPRGATDYDFKAWAADRTPMLKRGVTVAVDNSTLESWLDAGGKLEHGVVRLRFTQRWKSAHYADHGVKIIDLAFEPKTGDLLIRHEELLNSVPGFDDAPVEAQPIAVTISTAHDAPAALAKLGLTADDVDQKLAAIRDSATKKLLAGAILDGDLRCTQIVDEDECGEEVIEWAPLEPKLAWPDPCVRRRAALWAVAQLEPTELKRLAEKLLPVFAYGAPERELPATILARLRTADDALRLRFLRAAVDGKHHDLAEASAEGLGARALVIAATELHLSAAVAQIDVKRDREAALTAVADEQIDVARRSSLLDELVKLRGADVDEALRSVAGYARDCALAMRAADALAHRGDASYLPSRKQANLDRAVCLLLNDSDAKRAQARWLELVPARGYVIKDADSTRRVTRKTASLTDVPSIFGDGAKCKDGECTEDGGGGMVTYTYSITFEGGFVREIITKREEWETCGC